MKLLLPLRRKKESMAGKKNGMQYIIFIAVQEEKYQNQASGCCTRIHYNKRDKVIKTRIKEFLGHPLLAQHNSPQDSDR